MPRAVARIALGLAVMGMPVSSGCSSKPPVSSATTEATVSGTVTIRGKLATKGEVIFDPSNYRRKSEPYRTAPIGPDGRYSIKTLVGQNTVRVGAPEIEADEQMLGVLIPLDVKEGESTFDIEIPRPGP